MAPRAGTMIAVRDCAGARIAQSEESMGADPVFIQVGALAEGFAPDSHILAPVDDLAGRTLALAATHGATREYTFAGRSTLRWRERQAARDIDGPARDTSDARDARGEAAYRATQLREGVYFVDYVDPARRATSVSLVLDLRRGVWTSVEGVLPAEADVRIDSFSRVASGLPLTGVDTRFRHGAIVGAAAPGPLHAPTRELIGKRTMYRYSPTECYEHIYLNDDFYAWHCLAGVERGLADVDRCHSFKLAEALYLFVWREKVVPTLGVVLIDLDRCKTDGKIFGYREGDFGALSNFAIGAHAQVLNETMHPLAR
ncbi:molybdenum cofactor biosynthesis F family protein [Burkholderia pseudomallei]|uniref:molybdenum cofactor biosynthesis F family protein n=1 Tax=Burkholderia pseudomallei TaxID=28450 RepID=UPI0005723B8E|nr:molybdenum cofactor biosynthesis F family protein [Burkholderia pseudomallei]APY97135.1 molybdenum cofactor biosynthesis protein F [Burkholderia pseudomallei]OMO10588.1 molybdenum cofactor biosynthesis protein F [Burkholderia pseudomallei]